MADLDGIAKDVALKLCDGNNQMRYVLTALASAVQERLGEDVILCPRKKKRGEKASPRAAVPPAIVFTVEFEWHEQRVLHHYINYGRPDGPPRSREELLRVTLDVAHELGHLVLDRGPGQMERRIGISDNDLRNVGEVEAEWFALCILQMYGFLSLER